MTSHRAPWAPMLAVAAICAAIMAVCVMAGIWQYGRHVERTDAVDQFEMAAGLAPVEARPGVNLDESVTWRSVTASGVFDPDVTVLRNRPVDGSPAVHYLAWLDTEAGWMLVNLGYTAPGANPPRVPTETVTVAVLWRAWEEDDRRRGEGATRITPAQVPERTPAAEGYGMLRDDCTSLCSADLGLLSAPVPRLTTGPHLAYAWQWWGFALFAPVGAVLLLRREHEPGPAKARPARQRTADSDEDVEDALWSGSPMA